MGRENTSEEYVRPRQSIHANFQQKIPRTRVVEFRLKNISYSKQAAIIARKKEATAEKLNDTRNELSSMDEEINEKREQVQSFAGETVLRGDDFKRYVASLRGKSNTYKKRRAELSEYRAEYGVLSRTLGRCPII